MNMIYSSVLKIGPNRSVESVEPVIESQLVWSNCWTGHAIKPEKTGMNRENRNEPAVF
jgi:hypothetical protein